MKINHEPYDYWPVLKAFKKVPTLENVMKDAGSKFLNGIIFWVNQYTNVVIQS